MLVLRILVTGIWPDSWKIHWIAPLFKRAAVFKSKNYRGVHSTSQMSKVVERLLKPMFEPFLERIDAFGTNKFAYRAGRGCRDALALMADVA